MSLAGKLLYGTSAVTESAISDISDIDNMANEIKAVATESWTDTALESLMSDIYDIDKAYHTADIIAEVKVIREGADPAVLLEGIVSGGIEKIKNAFKTFWAKLKAWFAAIKRQFKIIFTKGKDFIKEFKTELNKKTEKGFTYTGREFTIAAGDTEGEKIFKAVEAQVNKLTDWSKAEKMTSGDVDKDAFITFLKDKGLPVDSKDVGMSSSDIQDKFIKDNKFAKGATDISELNERLVEMYHNGNDSDYTTAIDDFANVGKSQMMDFVENYAKAVKEIEKDEKQFDTLMNKIIKAYDGISKKDVGENEAAYKQAQYASRAITALLAVGKVPSTVKQAMYKQAAAQYESVLKAFLRWKPAKESAEVEENEDEDGDGLLEQAMAMISF